MAVAPFFGHFLVVCHAAIFIEAGEKVLEFAQELQVSGVVLIKPNTRILTEGLVILVAVLADERMFSLFDEIYY